MGATRSLPHHLVVQVQGLSDPVVCPPGFSQFVSVSVSVSFTGGPLPVVRVYTVVVSSIRTRVGVGVDALGNIYIADTGNHVLEKVLSGATLPEVPDLDEPSDPPTSSDDTTSSIVPAAPAIPSFTG